MKLANALKPFSMDRFFPLAQKICALQEIICNCHQTVLSNEAARQGLKTILFLEVVYCKLL